MDQQTEDKPPLPPFVEMLRAQGEARVRAQGEACGKREALLRLLARTGVGLTEEQRVRIEACDDLPTLDLWFDRAIGAKSAGELFV